MHHNKSKHGFIAFKIDQEKAYDIICWDFLELTLRDFDFLERVVTLIMWCVRSSNLSILWNWARLDGCKPSRGFRQGDPLPSYVFVICMEKLALSIQSKVDSSCCHSVKVSRGGPSIFHIFFVDDILLFCQATNAQVNLVSETLHDFYKASGLKVNFTKSRAMCSRHVPRSRREDLARISSINIVNDLGTYLGFPLVNGRVTKNTYVPIVEKI